MRSIGEIVSLSVKDEHKGVWALFKSKNRNVSDALLKLVRKEIKENREKYE
jgi:hypothetical protein